MKYIALISFLLGIASAWAQEATLVVDQAQLAPGGGTVVFKATVTYSGEPGALGWEIALPADWRLVSVSGPNVPAVAPEPGSTGALEFAFTSVPPHRAEFSVQVRYPANVTVAVAKPMVIVRTGGKLTTLNPPPVQMRAVGSGGS